MLIFNYPYTDLYSLNLDWIIKAIKEVQQVLGELGTVVNSVNGQSGDVVLTNEMLTSILGSVVNSVNGQAGAVVITKEMLTTILEGVVNSFNGRSGTVQLLPADVNATRIDITWTSDPGDTIDSLTQAEIDALYADGKRILIFVNNVGSPDQIYFLTIVGDAVTPQPYTPTATTSGVLSVNGQSGVVTLNADNLPVALGETDTIGDALDSKQATLTFDSAPTANSTNPVTSGGVYTADQSLGNAITTLAGTVNQHSDQIEALGPLNVLTSDSTAAALSAAQGKVLNDKMDMLSKKYNIPSDVVADNIPRQKPYNVDVIDMSSVDSTWGNNLFGQVMRQTPILYDFVLYGLYNEILYVYFIRYNSSTGTYDKKLKKALT